MAAPVRALLDTNVLLTATDEGRTGHDRALKVVNEWPALGTILYTSGQIIREYITVATRPLSHNGLSLAMAQALANAHAFRQRMRLLAEDAKVATRLIVLLEEIKCAGKQVHDANVVATMLVNGIGTLITLNTEDFSRYGRYIHVSGLPDDIDRHSGH